MDDLNANALLGHDLGQHGVGDCDENNVKFVDFCSFCSVPSGYCAKQETYVVAYVVLPHLLTRVENLMVQLRDPSVVRHRKNYLVDRMADILNINIENGALLECND